MLRPSDKQQIDDFFHSITFDELKTKIKEAGGVTMKIGDVIYGHNSDNGEIPGLQLIYYPCFRVS